MKLRTIGFVGGVVLLGGAVTAVVVTGHRPEWTTSSSQALAELEAGQDALQKIYITDARAHLTRALQLDPNFTIVKLFLARCLDVPATDKRVVEIIDELRRADLSKLSPREQFLIRFAVANHDKDAAKEQEILDAYVAKAPDDPFALEDAADLAVGRQDWAEAQRDYGRLMKVDPNRVSAYNQLGYLAMAQGRFDEAERMFQTYRYIAPDQANPHDSLGELLTLTGHFHEAEKEYDEALRIKPDFCATFQHLVALYQLSDRDAEADATFSRMKQAGACGEYATKQAACALSEWPRARSLDWDGAWKAASANCTSDSAADNPIAFTAAVTTGRRKEAEGLLERVKVELAKLPNAAARRQPIAAAELHMEGVLLLADGKAAEAADRFVAADKMMTYRELGSGLFKMFNGMYRASALQRAGARDEATKVIAGLREVNPAFVAQCGKLLGLALPSES